MFNKDHVSSLIVPHGSTRSAPPEETRAKAAQKISPFEKTLPFWSTYEGKVPHLKPLFDAREDYREYGAIGLIVTFDMLVEEVESFRLDVSSDKLSSLDRYLAELEELEKYGFDVAKPRCKLLFLQGELAKKADEIK